MIDTIASYAGLLIGGALTLLLFVTFFRFLARRTAGRESTIAAEIEDPDALFAAESSLLREGQPNWVTIASASTHQGFREADLHAAIAFLGSKGIGATFRTSSSAEGIQDFSLQVAEENAETARIYLRDFISGKTGPSR